MDTPQTTLRDVLEDSFNKVEAQQAPDQPVIEQPRDESGKFAQKSEEKPVQETKPETTNTDPVKVDDEKPALTRPTTWKKEYLPIWDKLSKGEPLTLEESAKLAAYSNQRETEYKTGVSTYKQEAMQAKELNDALSPFLPDLQAQNILPQQFVRNLANTHMILLKGTPDQKINLLTRIAQDYGIPLNAVAQAQQGNQIDPTIMQLMQELQAVKSQVTGVAGWKEQLETQQVQAQISEYQDPQKFPYFELAREKMAQLLETGQAQTLKEAYEKASEPFEELFQARLTQVQPTQSHTNQEVVQKAKAKAVSTKSATPSGSVSTSTAKDRRSILAEQVDALMGGARV